MKRPSIAFVLRISALAFVSGHQVVDASQALCDADIIPDEAASILNYFEYTRIGPSIRNRREPPKYAHNLWNCSEAASKDMPKTNNAVEGWHTSFEATLDTVHSHIYKFLNCYQTRTVSNGNEV